jgi:hypothetical protein
MLKALVFSMLLTGCAPWGVDTTVWNQSGTSCPDSDYDYGGTVELVPGYCKSGIGGFIALERNF